MRYLQLPSLPILEQLAIEEALLRTSDEDYCIINSGSTPAIVMGISGKPEELLNIPLVVQHQIPVYKRFSGGGTVYVDASTLFVTFMGSLGVSPFPKAILDWTFEQYRHVLTHQDFALRENDYCMGHLKCGGNAQYIQKGRWLHHTSFLWDYDEAKMEYLLLPKKRPEYRQSRKHADFLCRLKDYFESQSFLRNALINHLKDRFGATEVLLHEIVPHLDMPHRKSTVNISPDLAALSP